MVGMLVIDGVGIQVVLNIGYTSGATLGSEAGALTREPEGIVVFAKVCGFVRLANG